MFEGNSIMLMFDISASSVQFDAEFEGYFAIKNYSSQGWTESYVGNSGKAEAEHSVKYERAWLVSGVITALIDSGLTLKCFEEHPDDYWVEYPSLSFAER